MANKTYGKSRTKLRARVARTVHHGHFDLEGNENYTQPDIIELSRALTGYYVDYSDFSTQWDDDRHDDGEKVIFDTPGNYNTQQVIDHIFNVRAEQIASFICRKLYIEFVHNDPDEAIVSQLARVFIDHDFEIAPVLRVLFKSERFFDPSLRGSQIKSPVTMMTNLLHQINFAFTAVKPYEALYVRSSDLGQQLLQPPNVAGWKGHRTWLTTTTVPSRWEFIEDFLRGRITGFQNRLIPVVETLINPFDPHAAFKLPVALAQHFISIPIDIVGYEAPSGDFTGDLVSHPIPSDIMNDRHTRATCPKYSLPIPHGMNGACRLLKPSANCLIMRSSW